MGKDIYSLDNGDRIPLNVTKFAVTLEGNKYSVYSRYNTVLYLAKTYRYKKFEQKLGRLGQVGESEIRTAINDIQKQIIQYDVDNPEKPSQALAVALAEANQTIAELTRENMDLRKRLAEFETKEEL